MDERLVLLEQLEELLGEELVDADDAMELAIVAGLASRLGGEDDEALRRAIEWRDGPGAELLEEAWDDFDGDLLVEQVEALMDGQADDADVEEVLYDVDETVAAAVWSGAIPAVRPAASKIAASIIEIPDPFAPLADLGIEMSQTRAVGEHPDLYAFWMAVADAKGFGGEAE